MYAIIDICSDEGGMDGEGMECTLIEEINSNIKVQEETISTVQERTFHLVSENYGNQ